MAGPQEPVSAPPVVKIETVVPALETDVFADESADNTVAVEVKNPVLGLTYYAKDKDGKVLGEFTATEEEVTEGLLFIPTAIKDLEAVKTVTNDRVVIDGNNVTVKLGENEDLAAIADQYKTASLDKDAVALIGDTEIELSKDGAVATILAELNKVGLGKVQGKTYTVTLVNKGETEGTEYKITF